jgi:hypothetical protein
MAMMLALRVNEIGTIVDRLVDPKARAIQRCSFVVEELAGGLEPPT